MREIYLDNSATTQAVSYTHLDVYKRQEFDSIEEAPNSFLLNAAYFQAPYIFWYQNGTEPNTIADFAVLTPLVNDWQCIPHPILEQTARQMFGDAVRIVPEKPQYGYYSEYAMAYTCLLYTSRCV